MHFFERLLGFSPDGGNGSFEMACLFSGISTLAALFALKVIHRRRAARS